MPKYTTTIYDNGRNPCRAQVVWCAGRELQSLITGNCYPRSILSLARCVINDPSKGRAGVRRIATLGSNSWGRDAVMGGSVEIGKLYFFNPFKFYDVL